MSQSGEGRGVLLIMVSDKLVREYGTINTIYVLRSAIPFSDSLQAGYQVWLRAESQPMSAAPSLFEVTLRLEYKYLVPRRARPVYLLSPSSPYISISFSRRLTNSKNAAFHSGACARNLSPRDECSSGTIDDMSPDFLNQQRHCFKPS